MFFSYGYARQIINNRKNAAASLAILMAMPIRRYGAERIAQSCRSRATLDATGCCQRAIIRPVSPRSGAAKFNYVISEFNCHTLAAHGLEEHRSVIFFFVRII